MNKRIKVMHISEATSGGVWTHLKQLAENLPQSKFEQKFILSSIKNPKLKEGTEFQNYNFQLVDMVREINPIKDIISLIKIYKILKKEKPDIVHCHSSKAGVIGRIANTILRNKITLYTPHSYSFNDFNNAFKNYIYITVEKIMGLITTRLICVSEGEFTQSIANKIVDKEKLIVVNNGVQISSVTGKNIEKKSVFLKQHGYKGDEYVIGFVARLAMQKDPNTFIEACLSLKEYNIAVIILGDGPLEDTIASKIKNNDAENLFRVLGYVKNTAYYYENFDLFVSTSLWEGLPYSILEAMNAEVPIIATSIEGVTELIIDSKTGLLVRPKDVKGLSNQIKKLLSDKALNQKLSKNAKNHLITHYSIENMVEILSELYVSLYNEEKIKRNFRQN
ncbi:MAG: glycosyltransferase family 4 protein [Bacilli bacterium]